MDLAEYGRIADAEDSHWWYRGTRAMIREMLAPRLRAGIRVLDAGCGPGGNSAWLSEYGEVFGIDTEPEAVRLAALRHPAMNVSIGNIEELGFDDSSFDIVLVITVFALVADDRRAISEVARVLKAGGTAFLIEPSIPRLRRDHDAVTHTRRRYSLSDLRGLATGAGLVERRSTCAYSFLVPPALGLAGWHRIKPPSRDHASDLERDRLGSVFGRLAAAERRVLRRRDLPYGLSAIVVAERPGT